MWCDLCFSLDKYIDNIYKAGRQMYAGGNRRCEEDTDEERRAEAAHTLSSLWEE